MKALLAALFVCISIHGEDWESAFARIPIRVQNFAVHLTPPVELILTNFQPTAEIRAVVLMPGAADRLYFFDWGQADLGPNPTLLDAIAAITNKADLRVIIQPPFLLIGRSYDDPSDPVSMAADVRLDKLKLDTRKLAGRTYILDRPYDRLVPQAEKLTRLRVKPSRRDPASWHYYRVSIIGYDLTAHEFLQALGYATKTSVIIDRRGRATFAERPFLQ